MTKLIYIGGYGHSGSTLLEYLLTGCTELVACGEVASVVRDRLKKKHCTCGRRSEACPIWSQVLSSGAPLTEKTHEALTLALLARAGKRFDLMVDSTKTALGHALAPFRLRRALGEDFLLVHLVRDPRAVAWSAIKKTERRKMTVNRRLYCARVALAWSAANLACELFGLFHPKQYLRLRYEDFVAAPREKLDRIFQRMLPGAKFHAATLGVTDNRHQLYGNRMRGKPLTLEDVKEDRAWQTDMPASYRRVVSPLSAILRARYGYS
jgi:hypothetical protein